MVEFRFGSGKVLGDNSNGESSEVTMVEFRFGFANFIFNIKLIVTLVKLVVPHFPGDRVNNQNRKYGY
jgi:hypothetical protein